METAVKTKEKKKADAGKVIGIILAVIIAIAIVAVIFISVVTRQQKDTDENLVAVGGMVYSDTVEYKSEASDKLDKNPVMKLMEMIWYFCAQGDAKKHESQTPPEVEMIKDVPYIDDGNIYHKLDVFYPKGTAATEKLPVIIDIHGGGWMYATKDLNEYYCRAIANRGFVVFSISYRLAPDVIVPEQLQDCMTALKWINDNMADYPCNTDSIMLTGDSAGGQLSFYSAVLMQSEELREKFNVDDAGLDIDALLLTSPVAYMKNGGPLSIYTKILGGEDYKDRETYNFMDADEIVDFAEIPPTYLITSSGDSLANKQTHKLAELLETKGVQTVIRDYDAVDGKKLPHVFSVLFPFDEISVQTIDDATNFYREIIAEKETVNK